MRKIIAIGGGEIGRPGYPIETLPIDKEIIRSTGKKHPRLLFIPTASHDARLYIDTVQKYFGQRLGCRIDTLLVATDAPDRTATKEKISNADIIYVGGGNTLFLMKRWRKFGVDKLLKQAWTEGKVMAGVSAGAICWFKYGSSDSRAMNKPGSSNYIRVKGLGLINATLSPHHIREQQRKLELVKMIKKHGGLGLAVDDHAALEITDDEFRVITSKPTSKIYKVRKQQGKLIYEVIKNGNFHDL